MQFNGSDITGATSAVLTLTNLQYTDEGIYTFSVSNAYGGVTVSNIVVQVMGSAGH